MTCVGLPPRTRSHYRTPMEDDETRALLALSLCANGRPDQWLAFARRTGSAARVFASSDDELAGFGAKPKAIERLRDAWERSVRVLERCQRLAIRVAVFGDPLYPSWLEKI